GDAAGESQDDQSVKRGAPMSVAEQGIAYHVATKVAGVDPVRTGQPDTSLEPGDIILAVGFQQPKSRVELDAHGWTWAFAYLQKVENKDITVQVWRDGQRRNLVLTAKEDMSWPLEDRGLILAPDTRVQKSDNLLD